MFDDLTVEELTMIAAAFREAAEKYPDDPLSQLAAVLLRAIDVHLAKAIVEAPQAKEAQHANN